MKKIKVAHILHSVGGVDVYLRLVTENTSPGKVEHIIIHQEDHNKEPYLNNKERIKQYFIPIEREISVFKDFKAIYKTIKLLKAEKPNVIHAHSAKGGIIARVASLFYKVRVLHTPHAYSYLSASSKLKRLFFLKIEQLFKYFNSIVLSTSQSEKKRAIEDVHYKENKVIVFNNAILPIDINELDYSIINKLGLPKEYICTVGRPSYQKNIEFMVDVVYNLKKSIPQIHLVIMGVGEYSPNLDIVKIKIKELKLSSNITLVKWIRRKDIFSIINKSILYTSTSRYEGLPYSVIESLALSKAGVVTNCDGNRDLIKNKINGYLIEDNNIDVMASRISSLLLDEKIRKKFEKNSFDMFNKNFNLENNISKLEEIYKEFSRQVS